MNTRNGAELHLGGPAAVSPATWGQRYMWNALQPHRPNDGWTNIWISLDVPGGGSIGDVCLAVERALRPHESFRTSFRTEGARLLQLVSEHVTVPAIVLTHGSEECRQVLSQIRFDSYGQADGRLLRLALAVDGKDVRTLHLSVSHLLCDSWSIDDVSKRMEAELAGCSAVRGGDRQPTDRSSWENSSRGQEYHARAASYWREQLEHFPREYASCGEARAQPRFRIARITIPSLFQLAADFSERHRVAISTFAVGALAGCMARRLGVEAFPMLLRTANRAQPFATMVAQLSQEAPAVLLDMHNPLDTLKAFQHSVLRAMRWGAHDPDRLIETIDSFAAKRGGPPDLRILFNVHSQTPMRAASGSSVREFEWIGARAYDPVLLYCDVLPRASAFELMVDTQFYAAHLVEALVDDLDAWVARFTR